MWAAGLQLNVQDQLSLPAASIDEGRINVRGDLLDVCIAAYRDRPCTNTTFSATAPDVNVLLDCPDAITGKVPLGRRCDTVVDCVPGAYCYFNANSYDGICVPTGKRAIRATPTAAAAPTSVAARPTSPASPPSPTPRRQPAQPARAPPTAAPAPAARAEREAPGAARVAVAVAAPPETPPSATQRQPASGSIAVLPGQSLFDGIAPSHRRRRVSGAGGAEGGAPNEAVFLGNPW